VIQTFNECHLDCLKRITKTGNESNRSNICDNEEPQQKVISFSYFGNRFRKVFVNGIAENLMLMKNLYRGWRMRLYLNKLRIAMEAEDEICHLKCENDNLDICIVDSHAEYGDIWRFLPLLDKSVNIMLSRDLDSRLTIREVAAVKEWLDDTELAGHVMRDHPQHGAVIPAGMWGFRKDVGDFDTVISSMEKLFTDAKKFEWYKGLDQFLLQKWMWPVIEQVSCVHDSYLCSQFPSKNWRPFPTKRESGGFNFVGAAGKMEINISCPHQCRPQKHPDWELC